MPQIKTKQLLLVLALSIGSASPLSATAEKHCIKSGVTLQILGSGGPIAEGDRAGASNLVWIDGKSRLLVDAGPGSFIRYGEARASFVDHEAILFTHFHGDHVGGLAGILNNGSFGSRSHPLPIAGPTGSDYFPPTGKMLSALVGKEGVLGYLSPFLDGSTTLPVLKPVDIDPAVPGLQRVLKNDDIMVYAIGVRHGDVPALAYLVQAKGKTIIFAGDQNFLSEDFVETFKASKPDILVMHNAISMAAGQPRGLHRDGKSIGEAAGVIEPRLLVLTHSMKRALNDQPAVNAAIRENFKGTMVIANDLDCFVLPE